MSHWHKLGFQAFLAKEIMRKDTLPFAIGMGFVALMGLGLPVRRTGRAAEDHDRGGPCLFTNAQLAHERASLAVGLVLNDRKGDRHVCIALCLRLERGRAPPPTDRRRAGWFVVAERPQVSCS